MAIGRDRHLVTLEAPGDPVPDGEGGYTSGWAPLTPPTWYCSIQPTPIADYERVLGGAVVATATHLVEGRYRADLTIDVHLMWQGRTLAVNAVRNLDERNIRVQLVCSELVSDVQQPIRDSGAGRAARRAARPAGVPGE